MKQSKMYIIFFFSLVGLLVSCDDKSLSPTPSKEPDFSLTPMENEEAELLAIHLSGEIISPVRLYRKIKNDLELIRSTWSDSIGQVNIKYSPFSQPSLIYVGLDSSAFTDAQAGRYHEWDSLNNYYRMDSIRLLPQFHLAVLQFEGRLNPVLLVDAYSGLSGMQYSHTESWIGDWSTLVALFENNVVKYFFRLGFGDCPSGCIYSNFFYFTVDDDSAHYHGSYLTTYPPDSSTIPNWADSAMQALRDYRIWNHWP